MADQAVDLIGEFPYGLSQSEVAARQKQFGLNVLASSAPRSLAAIAFGTIREPMFLLLLACGSLYLILGDLGEAAIISSAVIAVIGITIIQERRTERTLDALKDLSSPRALVIRDGKRIRIAGRDLVPGDLAVLAEGDRVPADGFLLQAKSLKIDESLLTGESVAVAKVEWDAQEPFGAAGGDDTPFVYGGTLVVQGGGLFKVYAIGQSTVMGGIGLSLKQTETPPSRLQMDTRRVVTRVATASLLVSLVVTGVWWLRNREVLRSILMGLTFAMSTIPEEFPVVLTIFMALGAWRISRINVLTRRLQSIETLGSATVLCVDKTGTLTENKMRVSALWMADNQFWRALSLTDEKRREFRSLLEVGVRACDPHGSDPMDVAMIDLAKELRPQESNSWTLKKSYPLIRPLLAVGYAWDIGSDPIELAIKGAPESVLDLCQITSEIRAKVLAQVQALADDGCRVLAVARNLSPESELPERLTEVRAEFVGLIGYSDPLKQGVAEAVNQCHMAGIKVVMITGDYPGTAAAIARQAGLENPNVVLSGDEINKLSDLELAHRLSNTRVLARMVPEQKLRVVTALEEAGEVVAMTGDGVNDAPALKAAHIGVAMGGRGTDVAREASALVLLDDNFTSIVEAIRLGRRIFDNIQKAVSYIIAIHVPIAGLTLVPLAIGVSPILLPVHLAFLELIIDPVCSIVFEAEIESPTIMNRPPRPVKARLFSYSVVWGAMLEGVLALVAVLVIYFVIGRLGDSSDHARAVAFSGLIFLNLALILTLTSGDEGIRAIFNRPNKTLHVIGLIVALFSAVILYVPAVARVFHFESPHALDLLATVGVACVMMAFFELFKRRRRS